MLLPLAIALWLLIVPPPDRFSRISLMTGLASLTSALLLTGVWTVMPWWWPWLCAAIGLVGALRAWPSKETSQLLGWRWATRGMALVLTVLGGWLTIYGIAGRRMPGPAIELAFPLPPGRYIVANGGANLAISSHAETLDLSVPRHRLWQGQSYGVDIVALTAAGRSSGGWMPVDPKHFAIYSRPVLAPCAGQVVAAVDGLADTPIPLTGDEPSAGNHVLLRCGPANILMAHFRPGSVRIVSGQRVTVGQQIAEVGNSGSSSEPHLHIHAQMPGTAAAPFSGRPLPIRLGGRNPWRNARF